MSYPPIQPFSNMQEHSISLSSIALELADLNCRLKVNNAKFQAQLQSNIPCNPIDHVFFHHESLGNFALQNEHFHNGKEIQGQPSFQRKHQNMRYSCPFELQSSALSLVDNIHTLALQSYQFDEEVKKDLMSSMSRAHGVENQWTQMKSKEWNASLSSYAQHGYSVPQGWQGESNLSQVYGSSLPSRHKHFMDKSDMVPSSLANISYVVPSSPPTLSPSVQGPTSSLFVPSSTLEYASATCDKMLTEFDRGITTKNGAISVKYGATLTFESALEDFDPAPMMNPQIFHQPSQLMHFEASTLSSCQSFSTPSAPIEDQSWSTNNILAKEDSIDHGYWDSNEEEYPTPTLVEATSQEAHELHALSSETSVGESDHSCTIQVPSSPKCGDAFHPYDQMVDDCPTVEAIIYDDPDFLGVEVFLSKYEEWMPHAFPLNDKLACKFRKEHNSTLVWSTVQLICPKTLQHPRSQDHHRL